MAFAAGFLSKAYFSKQVATLAKALESVSSTLSIVALLGLALVPLAPHGAAFTKATIAPPQPAPAAREVVPAVAAPVDIVRAKPVLVPQAPPPSPDAASLVPPALGIGEDGSASRSLAILAKVSRERRRRARAQPKTESGEAGKAGTRIESGGLGKAGKTAAAKTPVTPPDGKSEAAAGEQPVPAEWSDAEIIVALRDCLKRLAPLGAEIEIAPPVKTEQCGNPAPVLLKRVGSGAGRVEFQPPPMLNCAMVAKLHTWVEKTLQPAAEEALGSSIARIRGAAGYACRNRNGTRNPAARLSEHALANAIDIMGFVTADGRTIDVLSKWGPTERDIREERERIAEAKAAAQRAAKEAVEVAVEAAKEARKKAAEAARAAAKAPASKRKQAKAEAERLSKEADQKVEEAERIGEETDRQAAEKRRSSQRTAQLSKLGRGVDPKAVPTATDARATSEAAFLRRLHKGACGTFGTVLGPEANEAHRNHFHFDLAPRRRSAYCE
jgi:hypothetical protein